MATEVTRYINQDVERELWSRAAGRCQFNGCNRLLYKSPVTQERVNIAEKAHIYSFSKNGPRGWGPFKSNKMGLNDADNLLLACHDCHKTIDKDKEGSRYSGALLKNWKKQHEERVRIVTGIDPLKKSHVIHYKARIGTFMPNWQDADSFSALFPYRYPAEEFAIDLSMQSGQEDSAENFFHVQEENLKKEFQRKISDRIEDGTIEHVSVFAMAPQPLLFLLGTYLGNIAAVEVYQRHRIPEQTWIWPEIDTSIQFKVLRPKTIDRNKVVLLFALSSDIPEEEIVKSIGGENFDLWKVFIDEQSVHYMSSRKSLASFYKLVGALYDEIKNTHGEGTEIHILPAMSNSCSVMAGRALMPKANVPITVYDKVQTKDGPVFLPRINIKIQTKRGI